MNVPKIKIELIHIPKCAGTSLGRMIYEDYPIAKHQTLKTQVKKFKNLSDIIFVAPIRNPIDRFISSYNYLMQKSYNGIYTKKFENLKELSPEQFFEQLKNELGLLPQKQFINYNLNKICLKLLRFEFLKEDLISAIELIEDDFSRKYWLNKISTLQHMNKSQESNPIFLDNKLRKKLTEFYHEDFELYNSLQVSK